MYNTNLVLVSYFQFAFIREKEIDENKRKNINIVIVIKYLFYDFREMIRSIRIKIYFWNRSMFVRWKMIYIEKKIYFIKNTDWKLNENVSFNWWWKRLSSEIEIDFPRKPRILSRDLTLDFTGKYNEQQLREHHHWFHALE